MGQEIILVVILTPILGLRRVLTDRRILLLYNVQLRTATAVNPLISSS
jgi:hypothetical protein